MTRSSTPLPMSSQLLPRPWTRTPPTQVNSRHRRVSGWLPGQWETQQLGSTISVDKRLRNSMAEVCRHPEGTPERQKALNRLLASIQQLPGIYKSSHPDYLSAWNRTLEWLCHHIDRFEVRSPSVTHSFVIWINGYLKWRLRDLYAPDEKYSLSLDRPIAQNEGEFTTHLDNLRDPTPALSTLEGYIAEIQQRKRQRQGQAVRQYLEGDPEGKLTRCHPRKSPQCHCQYLAKRLLLQDPPDKIADIAREIETNNQTLYSHWKQKCLPLLQEIARQFGEAF